MAATFLLNLNGAAAAQHGGRLIVPAALQVTIRNGFLQEPGSQCLPMSFFQTGPFRLFVIQLSLSRGVRFQATPNSLHSLLVEGSLRHDVVEGPMLQNLFD